MGPQGPYVPNWPCKLFFSSLLIFMHVNEGKTMSVLIYLLLGTTIFIYKRMRVSISVRKSVGLSRLYECMYIAGV